MLAHLRREVCRGTVCRMQRLAIASDDFGARDLGILEEDASEPKRLMCWMLVALLHGMCLPRRHLGGIVSPNAVASSQRAGIGHLHQFVVKFQWLDQFDRIGRS